ncbi:MAG TPA: TolC family protein [Clostridium sp.]
MKKGFISFLIMTLMITSISLANISSVQAATTDNTVTTTDNTIKVSLENIRDIMIENNLDIKIQHDALEIVQEEYHDARDTYQNDSEPDQSNYTTKDASGNTIPDTKAYETAVNKYNTEKSTYETKLDAYKTAKTAYDKAVEAKVIAAQGAYINYLSNLSDAKLKDDAVKSNEKEEQVYKLQYESGFISKNKYTSLLQNNTTPVNELKQLKDSEELARIKLCNTLGISPEKNIIFNTDITQDFEVISKIDYNTDLEKMLENNIEIKDKNDEIDDLKDAEDDYDNEDLYDYKVEKANNELKLLMNDTETSFKEQYNTLMNSYNSIKSSYDNINQEKNTYSIMQTKYDYGFVSQKEVNDEKLTLDTNESALQAKKNTLYVNYLNYLQTKEGY